MTRRFSAVALAFRLAMLGGIGAIGAMGGVGGCASHEYSVDVANRSQRTVTMALLDSPPGVGDSAVFEATLGPGGQFSYSVSRDGAGGTWRFIVTPEADGSLAPVSKLDVSVAADKPLRAEVRERDGALVLEPMTTDRPHGRN